MIAALPSILYVGLRLPSRIPLEDVLHYPVVRIEPRPWAAPEVQEAFYRLPEHTHLIFTSRSAVTLFFYYLALAEYSPGDLMRKTIAAIGLTTAKALEKHGVFVDIVAQGQTSEGFIGTLDRYSLENAHVFWAHSARSRRIIPDYFDRKGVLFSECELYDTVYQEPHPIPNLAVIKEFVFTSPSTVDGFLRVFGKVPMGKKLSCIGPVTEKYLKQVIGR